MNCVGFHVVSTDIVVSIILEDTGQKVFLEREMCEHDGLLFPLALVPELYKRST
jgi:hypothetical protein